MIDDFYITVFSNSGTNKYNNTLTNFSNDLPSNLWLSHEDNWHLAIENIGYHSKFKDSFSPVGKYIPSIIILHEDYSEVELLAEKIDNIKIFGELDSEVVFDPKYIDGKVLINFYDEKNNHIYFQKDLIIRSGILYKNQPYSYDTHFFKKAHDLILFKTGIEFKVSPNEYSTLITKVLNYENLSGSIVFHKNIIEILGFPQENFEVSYLYGEKYYVLKFKPGKNIRFTGNLTAWHKNYPKIVKVICDQIKTQKTNDKLTKELKICSPSFRVKDNFYFNEFDSLTYYPLENTSLDKISLSLKDEYDNYLNMYEGHATFAKLHLKKMSNNYEGFNIKLTSHNSPGGDFSVNLSYPYYLNSDWKVSLTYINYPHLYLPLSFHDIDRQLYCARLNGDNKTFFTTLSNYQHTLDDIYHLIANFFLKVDSNIWINRNNSQNPIEWETFIEIGVNNICMLSKPLAELIGFTNADLKEKEVFELEGKIFFSNIKHNNVKKLKIKLKGYPDIDKLKPNYLMIYSDIIDSNIVGSANAKLLKIVPIVSNKNDSYNVYECKHKEFHSLENTYIQSVKIQIRSHSGDIVNFIPNHNVFINLLFEK